MNTSEKPQMNMDAILGYAIDCEVPAEVRAKMEKRLADLRGRLESDKASAGLWARIAVLPIWAKAAGIAAAASVVALIGYFAFGNGSGIALADVIEKVRLAKTLQFTWVTQVGDLSPVRMSALVLEPGKMRITAPDGIVNISDQVRQEMLILWPSNKRATLVKINAGANPGPAYGFLETLRRGQGEAAETLPAEQIDGRIAKGFCFRKDGVTLTMWADAETGDPLRVEIDQQLPAPSRIVMDSFVLNVDLDESLFSLVPPPGYTVESAVMDLITKPTEKDLEDCLRALVSYTQGRFPDEFTMMGMTRALEDFGDSGKAALEPGKEASFGFALGRGFAFAQGLKPENEWRYVGRGVKLGEANKAVCWWCPTAGDSGLFRVIYGDLSVRDVSAADLPELPAESPAFVITVPKSLGPDEYIRIETNPFIMGSSFWIHKPVGTFQAKNAQLENMLKSVGYAESGTKLVFEGATPAGRYEVMIKVPPDRKETLMPRVRACLEEAFRYQVIHRPGETVLRFSEQK